MKERRLSALTWSKVDGFGKFKCLNRLELGLGQSSFSIISHEISTLVAAKFYNPAIRFAHR